MSDKPGPRKIALAPQEVTAPPQQGTVELLEKLLADARAGKIRAVAVAYQGAGNDTSHGWAVEEATAALLPEIDWLKLKLLTGTFAEDD